MEPHRLKINIKYLFQFHQVPLHCTRKTYFSTDQYTIPLTFIAIMKFFHALPTLLLPSAFALNCKIKWHGGDSVNCYWYPTFQSQNHYTFKKSKDDDNKSDKYPCYALGEEKYSGYE